MLPWVPSCLVIATLLITAGLTPLVLKACRRLRIFDRPGERKIHERDIPRLGGVAIFCSLVLVFGLATLGTLVDWLDFTPVQAQLAPLIFAGLCGFFIIGFIDDIRSLPALPRLIAQFVVAGAIVWFGGPTGVRISALFGQTVLPEWASMLLTILWIVGVVNTFNWIDGLDGLAAGLAGIAGTAFLVIALARPFLPNSPLTVVLSAMLVGAVLGFIPYNFQPARIFIGDGGAFSLGYLLAVISVVGLFKQAAVISFIVPVFVLALPITDTLFAILRRLFKGQPITKPDNRHIHHRMLALLSHRYRQRLTETQWTALQERLVTGLAHRNTVLALYAFAAVFAAIAVLLGVNA